MGSMAYSAKVVLRVYDVTDIIFNGNNAHKYFDIEIRGGARNWYIKVGESDRSFCVDMGFLTSYGTFFVIVRSNVVKTPRVGVSEIIDEDWLFEAITETYIPLINVFDRLIEEGIDFRITMSLSPPLISMLADELLQTRYIRYIEKRIQLTGKEIERTKHQKEFNSLARRYNANFTNARYVFAEKYQRNIVQAFKKFQDAKS